MSLYKYPHRADFVESLPCTVSGKLRRAAIR
jgi:acyl-coenzyme A synthetase/AMP-(fatty) acid ligase